MWTDNSRRRFLQTSGIGIGWLAALDLFHRTAAADTSKPLAPNTPPMRATAKGVISLFMQGGPSHIDTFDPKPLLNRLHGRPLPPSVTRGLRLQFTHSDAAVLGSPQTFSRCGRSGLEIADTLVTLQPAAIRELPKALRAKAVAIIQSAVPVSAKKIRVRTRSRFAYWAICATKRIPCAPRMRFGCCPRTWMCASCKPAEFWINALTARRRAN